MARRSTRQQLLDERSLPVRVRLLVPEGGIRNLPEIHAWLSARAPGAHAVHSACEPGFPDAVFVYLNDPRLALELMERFGLQLAGAPRRVV